MFAPYGTNFAILTVTLGERNPVRSKVVSKLRATHVLRGHPLGRQTVMVPASASSSSLDKALWSSFGSEKICVHAQLDSKDIRSYATWQGTSFKVMWPRTCGLAGIVGAQGGAPGLLQLRARW